MKGIDILINEHKNILKFIKELRQMCIGIINGDEVNTSLVRECVQFGRIYADKHHHGKEEKILFRIMLEKPGTVAEKLIKNGMLVEHDLGRYHMGKLEEAANQYDMNKSDNTKLDIITHATGYADLLKRHIEKEDSVCYTYAERTLSEEDKNTVDEETLRFEEEADKNGIQEKYVSWLERSF